jgi:hypothetical protein
VLPSSRLTLLTCLIATLCVSADAAAQQRRARSPWRPLSIEVRVRQYWTTRMSRDLTGAYAFYCQSYKSRVPLADYVKQTRLTRFQMSDVQVRSTTPRRDGVEVTLSYRFLAPLVSPTPLDGETTEMWARDRKGSWCKQDEPLVLPFPTSGPPGN